LVKRPIVIPFDLVVHAIGMDPNLDNPEIAKVFGVGLEKHGFIDRGEHYTSSFASTRRGIYVGGSALGPEDIDTCVSHGLAMAMRAVGDLSAVAQKAA
jgi:heterodisulfide reductase subunit A